MKKYYLFIPLAFLLVFTSCSNLRIEKRHYNKGFYVDFSNDSKTKAAVATDEQTAVVADAAPSQTQMADPAVQQPASVSTPDVLPAAAPSAENKTVVPAVSQNSAVQPSTQHDATVGVAEKAPAAQPGSDADTNLVLLFILALLIPPLAVFLKQGVTTIFWIDLICALFGCGFLFAPYFGGLFLAAIVIAILVVFDVL